jgi:hypothetical protein
VALALREGYAPNDLQGVVEMLSSKLGVVLLVLGGMHFFNLFVFSKMRKKAVNNPAPPVIGTTLTPAAVKPRA